MVSDKEKFRKLQINLSKNALDKIEEMQKRIHASSRTEVIRNSLKFYNFVTEEKKKDEKIKIVLRDSNGKEKEILF